MALHYTKAIYLWAWIYSSIYTNAKSPFRLHQEANANRLPMAYVQKCTAFVSNTS